MITNTHQLNPIQLQDLLELQSLCVKQDGNSPNLYTHILNQPRTLPAALLAYERSRLVGFLSVFFFYEESVEISLLVAPNARKKGLAKQLLRSIIPLIQTYQFPTLIFSSPAGLNDDWLSGLGFTYQHSEYHMVRKNLNPFLNPEPPCSIRLMQESDIPALIHLDEVCFSKQQVESQERFNYLINDKAYQIFVILENDHPVAKAHLRWENHGATLSDIAVLPALQGQGLGTALIAHCINVALSDGKPDIRLDVETKNERALGLYTRLGFLTENSCDYWKIGITQLKI